MKEKIYTIPVNDAFDKDCECPLCAMYQELENNAVEYTMGPSTWKTISVPKQTKWDSAGSI